MEALTVAGIILATYLTLTLLQIYITNKWKR
mgnify:CR=1 FL=1